MEKPLVSVLMITYNHEAFIRQAIEGVLMQKTTFPIELIIADDASTDKNQEIIRAYALKSEIIKPILRDKNLGANENWLDAVHHCTGKYIALCEGDDYWTDPLKLQKQVDFLEGNEGYFFCWHRFKTLNQQSFEFSIDKNQHYFENCEPDGVVFDFKKFAQGWHIGMQTLMFRANIIDLLKVKGQKNYKDVFLIVDILNAGLGWCLNEFMAVYRIHSGGVYSGANAFQNSKKSSNVYREIFVSNRSNVFLRKKYIRFSNSYIYELIENRMYFSSIKELLKQYFTVYDYLSFKHNIKMLLISIKNKL